MEPAPYADLSDNHYPDFVELMPTAGKILVVDDVASNLRILALTLEHAHHTVVTAQSGADALAICRVEPPALVLLDLRMPEVDGLETLRRLKAVAPNLPVVMITGDTDVSAAVQATKLGAYDFLVRPVDEERLLITIGHALERSSLRDEVANLRQIVGHGGYLSKLVLPSACMRSILEQISSVAKANLTVLVQGRTGTGKEVVARAIHHESRRAEQPFVAVDCGAIPESLVESELFGFEKGAFSGADRQKDGYFQAAQKGTLFLDEVGNLSLAAQAKLLRVIQERQVMPIGTPRAIAVDVRIIAATNAQLEDRVREGAFREDLYYRLAEFVILLPPLRDRPEDIPALARMFVDEASVELHRSIASIDDDAIRLLQVYAWPGNIRELRNTMRRAVLQSKDRTIGADDLGPLLAASGDSAPAETNHAGEHRANAAAGQKSLKDIAAAASETAERQAIAAALKAAGGNKSSAARMLKIDYKTLFAKLRRYEM
jgi:DNA-binding NtrC family response regulator